MHQLDISQRTTENKNVHISLLNGTPRDTQQERHGIHEVGQFIYPKI